MPLSEFDLNERARRIGQLFKPSRPVIGKFIRIGCNRDGGYVMHERALHAKTAISIGIGEQFSWDQTLAEHGIIVHGFDCAESSRFQHDNFSYHSSTMCPNPTNGQQYNFATLQQFLKIPAICKMDIDGAEWALLQAAALEDLVVYSQIVMEIHFIFDIIRGESNPMLGSFEDTTRTLEKLNQLFQVAHIHANNNGGLEIIGNVPIPGIIEVTYLNRNDFTFSDAYPRTFPDELDCPNTPVHPDMWLGTFSY